MNKEEDEKRLKPEELNAICWLTKELTQIRFNGCNHLSVENFSPDLFFNLLTRYSAVINKKWDICSSGLAHYEPVEAVG